MPDPARHLDRVAVLSDVHGNLTAYQAVLDDIDARGITRVISLGDHLGKGPRGSACVALTQERCEAAVQGNWEAFLTNGEPVAPLAAWARDEVTSEQLAWLAALPFCHDLVLSGRRIRLLHASAAGVFTRISYDHTWEEFHAMFTVTEATGPGPTPDVVGCGDIHGTYLQGDEDKTLFNVGSAGNPLDATTASYAVLEGVADADSGPFSVAFVRVAYDIEAEVAVAAASGMPRGAGVCRRAAAGDLPRLSEDAGARHDPRLSIARLARSYSRSSVIVKSRARSRSTRASPIATAGVSTPPPEVSGSSARLSADSPSITAVAAYPGSPLAATTAT